MNDSVTSLKTTMSKPTFFTEVETIDIGLKIVELLELLHDNNVVHSNLCPQDIFLKDKKLSQIQFANLFHCAPEPLSDVGFKHINNESSISNLDTRLRNSSYISPEQLQVGNELNEITSNSNGMIDETSQAINDFKLENECKVNKKCDFYSLGAILYKCLFGEPPELSVAQSIASKRLFLQEPDKNIYQVPFFSHKKIISDQMCFILVRLLCENPKYRFEDLGEIKQSLLQLRKSIFQTPKLLRTLLKHPVLPGE